MTPGVATQSGRGPRAGAPLPPKAMAGFVLAVVAVAVVAYVSYLSVQARAVAARQVTWTLRALEQEEGLLSLAKDAETGQRGYLLSNAESYLEPFNNARSELPGAIKRLRDLEAGNQQQLQRLDTAEQMLNDKLAELTETVDLKRSGKAEGAVGVLRSDRGKELMDRIRAVIGQMEADERALLLARQEEASRPCW